MIDLAINAGTVAIGAYGWHLIIRAMRRGQFH